jgi:hypothetical protein
VDIKDIRVKNLNGLLISSGLSRELFAESLGYKDVNYLNQLLAGKGSFGSGTARKIAVALGKDSGWLDRVHGDGINKWGEKSPIMDKLICTAGQLSESDLAQLIKYALFLRLESSLQKGQG